MTDTTLRELERRHQDSPEDSVLLERLEAAMLRAGRGWRGEALPFNDDGQMLPDDERRVYEWDRRETPEGSFKDGLMIPFVYVPGGEVECDHLEVRVDRREGPPWRGTITETRGHFPKLCTLCNGTGKRKIAPAYLSRFPVTFREYIAFCKATRRDYQPPSWAPSKDAIEACLRGK